MVAQKYTIKVMAGAWINSKPENNAQEINAVIALANQYDNIHSVLVGNEVLLRKELSVNQLIDYVDQVKAQIRQPVSAGETLDFWMANPELVKHVDFIAVHIFPYWNGIAIESAITKVQRQYSHDGHSLTSSLELLHSTYPAKKIVIAETGCRTKVLFSMMQKLPCLTKPVLRVNF